MFYSDESAHTGNSKEVKWMISQMKLDKRAAESKKRGRPNLYGYGCYLVSLFVFIM